MTIKEAILKTLEDNKKTMNRTEVYKYICEKRYYDFYKSKTPDETVSARLGDFIRNSDTRVKRVKNEKGVYNYYLAKYENEIDFTNNQNDEKTKTIKIKNAYNERDLHKLISTYLNSKDIKTKTIFHEKSTKDDNAQIWTHPDMVGIKVVNYKNSTCKNFAKSVNSYEFFEISSYEVKKEIKSDTELKQFFFQAVSNSSWANYGYLVAFNINGNLFDEIKRLSQTFGIGVILLAANPFESKTISDAKKSDLDFKMIDKLCSNNIDFQSFIENVDKLISADEKYFSSVEKELTSYCDKYFGLDENTKIADYCKEKNIPYDDDIEN